MKCPPATAADDGKFVLGAIKRKKKVLQEVLRQLGIRVESKDDCNCTSNATYSTPLTVTVQLLQPITTVSLATDKSIELDTKKKHPDPLAQ